MRFMMIVKANKDSEAGALPSKELVAAMGKFNEEMVKAGVMLAAEGLQPSSKGVRITDSGGQRSALRGPFPDIRELVAGFWIIQAKSLEEAIEWGMRCPNPMGEGMESEIEIRPLMEASDFPPEVFPPEEVAREQRLREEMARQTPKP